MLECERKAKKKYSQKCHTRNITFYSNEEEQKLYEFSKTINFQGEVKQFLKRRFRNTQKKIKKGE